MATIKDVAQMAQVSAMTVSRVLNQKGYVSEEKRQRVLSCVEALGYRPNQLARSLVLNRSSTVGILLSLLKTRCMPSMFPAWPLTSESAGWILSSTARTAMPPPFPGSSPAG